MLYEDLLYSRDTLPHSCCVLTIQFPISNQDQSTQYCKLSSLSINSEACDVEYGQIMGTRHKNFARLVGIIVNRTTPTSNP